MATEIDKLLEELQLLSPEEMRRVRRAIDELLAESGPATAANGSRRLEALNRLRKELVALPVENLAVGLSNRDHDKLLYGGDS